ncbi:hypothetical protein EPN83_02180 [Patescibacteria group bacterium]|nr:MAG: hypothetical protein EPN83_02180 [Patescibacteria group bacterium]
MTYMKKNVWLIGFAVILIGAFGAMLAARKNVNIPSPTSTAAPEAQFAITAEDHIKGAQFAKVTIIEFSDFQCPACRAYYPLLNEVLKNYPNNDVRVIYKHFPLVNTHIGAEPAARASEAAALQGKFWEMHDLIFDKQESWATRPTRGAFEDLARELNLDINAFRRDYDLPALKNHVQRDLKEGIDLGVNSTPTFYLNGRKIENPRSLEDFKALIDTALANPL